MKLLRTFAYLCSSAFICGCIVPAATWAQCPARTTVAETLYNADGSLAEGRMVIAWQAFAIGACQVPAGQTTVTITAGALSTQLYPNTTAVPAGTSYRVTYYLKSGRISTEYWVVPASGAPVGLAAVRSATVPVPNVMFSQSQVTNLPADLAKKVELPAPCIAGKFLQANGSSAAPQVDCVDAPAGGGGGGSGTVTNVALSAPGQFAVSGSPVTTSGTLGLSWLNQAANTVLAGPASGAAATPAFRALAAADIPPLDAARISSGSLPDARVDDTITLNNLTQITTRNFADLQNIPATFTPAAHALDGAAHTVSGLTAGHFLKALSATTFGFAQVAFSNLSGSIAATQQNPPAVGAKGGVEAKTCSGTDKLSAIGTDGVPVCSADQTGGGAAHDLLSATHSDATAATAARGAGIFGIGASPKWERVSLSAANRYFKRDAAGDIVESSSAAAGTGACTNQFVRSNNADAAPTCATVQKVDAASTFAHTDQSNTYSAGTQDFAAATALKVPTAAGTAEGHIRIDTTQHAFKGYTADVAAEASFPRVLSISRPLQTKTNSTTSDQDFNSLYTLPANFFVANKAVRITIHYEWQMVATAPGFTHYLKLGSTKVVISGSATNGSSFTRNFAAQFLLVGTAAPGASVAVEATVLGMGRWTLENIINSQAVQNHATNGTLAITPGITYSSTSGTGSLTIRTVIIEVLN